MKIRNGFVSNSSSSSFVILKYFLSDKQIDDIFNYVSVVEEYNKGKEVCDIFEYVEWGWAIKDIDDFIFGETSMDNFDMYRFLDLIKVDGKYIHWDDGYNDFPFEDQLRKLEIDRLDIRKKKLESLL